WKYTVQVTPVSSEQGEQRDDRPRGQPEKQREQQDPADREARLFDPRGGRFGRGLRRRRRLTRLVGVRQRGLGAQPAAEVAAGEQAVVVATERRVLPLHRLDRRRRGWPSPCCLGAQRPGKPP